MVKWGIHIDLVCKELSRDTSNYQFCVCHPSNQNKPYRTKITDTVHYLAASGTCMKRGLDTHSSGHVKPHVSLLCLFAGR